MEYIGIQKKNGGVVEALQQAILSGQIPAGTEMTQNELAESLPTPLQRPSPHLRPH